MYSSNEQLKFHFQSRDFMKTLTQTQLDGTISTRKMRYFF